jgi:hypothetical protein
MATKPSQLRIMPSPHALRVRAASRSLRSVPQADRRWLHVRAVSCTDVVLWELGGRGKVCIWC